MTKNALIKLGFKQYNYIYELPLNKHGVDMSIVVNMDNKELINISLDCIFNNNRIPAVIPNIKTISQLKTFIKLLSND